MNFSASFGVSIAGPLATLLEKTGKPDWDAFNEISADSEAVRLVDEELIVKS